MVCIIMAIIGFRDLQNYTTLKQYISSVISFLGFRDLQNYTTLKHFCSCSNVNAVF